jgi:hypothetical protein
MRKLLYGLILAFALSSLFPAAAHADTAVDEGAFVAKINGLRGSLGLAPLQVNGNLTAKARAWSAGMAAAGKIWHSTLSDGITEDWMKLGENVGMGGSVDALHKAFVNSPHHYENLVDPAFGYVGIGIVMNGSTIYVTEEFMQLMPPKTPAAPIKVPLPKPTTTTTAKPPAPKPAPTPAVAAVKPPAPATTTTTAAAAPPSAEAAATPVAGAPTDTPRDPSPLLVSVLERLRTFDS